MEVTSVRIYPVDSDDGRLLAYSSVVLDEEFAVHDIRLVVADSGVIVAMPNKEHEGGFQDLAHPITNDCRLRLKENIIRQYNEKVSEENELNLDEVLE